MLDLVGLQAFDGNSRVCWILWDFRHLMGTTKCVSWDQLSVLRFLALQAFDKNSQVVGFLWGFRHFMGTAKCAEFCETSDS